jgi:hypothetical protein
MLLSFFKNQPRSRLLVKFNNANLKGGDGFARGLE